MKELSKVQDSLANLLGSKLPMESVKDVAPFTIFVYPIMQLFLRMAQYSTFFYYVLSFAMAFGYALSLVSIVINFANKKTVFIGAYFASVAVINLLDIFRGNSFIIEFPWVVVYGMLASLFFICNSPSPVKNNQPVYYNPQQPQTPVQPQAPVQSYAPAQPATNVKPQDVIHTQAPIQPQALVQPTPAFETKVDSGRVCPKCGAPLKPGGLFCGSCGTKVG